MIILPLTSRLSTPSCRPMQASPNRKSPLTSSSVQFDQLDSVPLAVIRRQASASELSRAAFAWKKRAIPGADKPDF
jgi:hypothetical protein